MRFRYDALMSSGVVDREKWAKVVAQLIADHTRGKKATFARLVGFDPTTIGHWLRGTVAVSEASVRQVAERTGRNPMGLLIEVGVWSIDELPVRPTEEEIDEEISMVLDAPGLDDQQKMLIIQELEAWRTEDRELQERLAARDKERRIAQLRERIEQAHRAA